MTRAVYLVGAPGSGKSTLMAELASRQGPAQEEIHLCRETWVVPFGDAWMMGRLRDKFPGTDALGRASCRYFREWIEEGNKMPDLVMGEGIRLANMRFLLALDNHTDMTVYHIQVPDEELERRRLARDGDQQLKATFVSSVNSTVTNLCQQLQLLGVDVVSLDGRLQPAELVEQIRL